MSAHALDGVLSWPGELRLSLIEGDAIALGAFQRAKEVDANGSLVLRRVSGGPPLALRDGTIHLALALANPAALAACDPPRLVNRYVRPLLRALSTFGAKGAFFGRDWVSVAHRPAAWIGFAHDATTGRAVIEAVVSVKAPFTVSDASYASFLDKTAITLEEATGRSLAMDDVARAIALAYAKDYDGMERETAEPMALPLPVHADPMWRATLGEVIGIVGAGRDRNGVFRVGGELLASRDAVASLERAIAGFDDSTELDAIGAAVDRTLVKPGTALHGIRSLKSVRDVIAAALAT